MSKSKSNGDRYITTPQSGTVVNISELVRIYHALDGLIKPGMTEAEIDRLIHETIKRMSPN